jgi:type III pantothenate kinase
LTTVQVVADLGNSRLKWARRDDAGRLEPSIALPLDDEDAWREQWRSWMQGSDPAQSSWAIATVNPPLARRLGQFLAASGVTKLRWFRSMADVPVAHGLEHAESAGADRALAVLAAIAMHAAGRPGFVVLCGSAVTVERVSASGVWEGGAIAPGLVLTAHALHERTAQLPLIVPREAPPPYGRSTVPALEAGIFWGTVGAVRELLVRQAQGMTSEPWTAWTGGDAALLCKHVAWPASQVIPDLVLHGLARAAWNGAPPAR